MKFSSGWQIDYTARSPPSRGAWIEILIYNGRAVVDKVAPLAGGVD